ncbi:MAG: acyltransferase [Muribaculaceae bacterium]|nr:acyltransferase [Muribaculaceae bacterium]
MSDKLKTDKRSGISAQADSNAKGGRMANLELLRCIAMMMVIVLHFLGKGNLLPPLDGLGMDTIGYAAWLLESFCIVAVNVYMMISGYFLCTSPFKLSRLIGLWFQIAFYSIGFGLIGALTGILTETPFDVHYILTLVFPISMGHYWFLTAYVFLYLLLPFVGRAVRQMSRSQLQWSVTLLFCLFCLLKSILPLRLEMDSMGYDCLWYLCVFLAAAYIRRFGVPFLEKKGHGLLTYAACCLAIFAGTMGLRGIYLKTGSFGLMLKMFLEYNHILPFLAAAGLFAVFAGCRIRGRLAAFITRISPYTLGVYLLHENIGFRYSWPKWFGAADVDSVPGLLFCTLTAVACVFCCGILIDILRSILMKGLHGLLQKLKIYRKVTEKISGVDALFRA